MSYFSSKSAPKVDRASAAEILACFQDDKDLLFRLAWLITGNEATAERSVIAGRETALHGPAPFQEWLLEWAKWVTIKAALTISRDTIRHCEPAYEHLHCTHATHLLSQSVAFSGSKKDLLVHINPHVIFTELDPLARAVLVLRTAVNASIFDCVRRLGVSHEAVLAANCRAITWLHEVQFGRMPQAPSVCADAVAARGNS
jgi:hypothetical protein